jgi:3-deoxy-D-manno-octulosonic-acid transferase
VNTPSPGWLYRLLALALFPVWLVHALQHGRRHGVDNYRAMRSCVSATDDLQRVWMHAASVGEVRAITPLVRALMERGESILFTSFTATGYRTIRQEFGDSVFSSVIPIDCIWHCRRFYRVHNIRLGVVMETELWPELLFQARCNNIELILVNARLSKKSLNTGRFVRGLLSRTLAYFSRVLTRSSADRGALLSLGAQPDRISILGNLKTQRTSASPPTPERIVERDYLLLASSHEGEERDFLAARPKTLDNCLLVIAPRHPNRSCAIQAQIEALGQRYSVRSQEQPVTAETEVYLADTLGELAALMAHARIVIMGGSFDDTGGHNLIEPASLGCTIITGPSDSNIRDDIEMLGVDHGLLQVDSIDACWASILVLLDNPEQAQALGRDAQARLAHQPDILQSYLDALTPYL